MVKKPLDLSVIFEELCVKNHPSVYGLATTLLHFVMTLLLTSEEAKQRPFCLSLLLGAPQTLQLLVLRFSNDWLRLEVCPPH